MKVMKTDEWEFCGIESKEDTLAQGFVFQNKKYGDYAIVKAAKYIIKSLSVVIFLTFSAGTPRISLSRNVGPEVILASPVLNKLQQAPLDEQVVLLESLANKDAGTNVIGTDEAGNPQI